jgi:hypothetical protein
MILYLSVEFGAFWALSASASGCILSRRDSLTVARYEVPGVMRKIAPSQRDDRTDHGLD